MSAQSALVAIRAIECIARIMDICDEYDEEDSRAKRRKMYARSEDLEFQILKDVAWKSVECEFCPLNMENFNELCNLISTEADESSLLVPTLSIKMRLAITLRFLIAGNSHRVLERISLVSRKSTYRIVPQIVKLLADILEKEHMKWPKTQSDWLCEVEDFQKFWEFPHTLGILDMRSFRIKSLGYSSKSIILLSVLDAHSRFQYIEFIECEEDEHHTAYINSQFYKTLQKRNKRLNIPSDKSLEGQSEKTPYFFVGNEIIGPDKFVLNAFKKSSSITRSQQAFNFRIKRVRLPAQMAFEIMFYKFKVFTRINEFNNLEKAKLVIRTCCLLHNYLTQKLTQPLDYNDDITSSKLDGLDTSLPKQMNESNEADNTRDNVCRYCVNEGNIAEQWQEILK